MTEKSPAVSTTSGLVPGVKRTVEQGGREHLAFPGAEVHAPPTPAAPAPAEVVASTSPPPLTVSASPAAWTPPPAPPVSVVPADIVEVETPQPPPPRARRRPPAAAPSGDWSTLDVGLALLLGVTLFWWVSR